MVTPPSKINQKDYLTSVATVDGKSIQKNWWKLITITFRNNLC